MNFCWLGIHKWGKWINGVGEYFYKHNSDAYYEVAIQYKYCDACGIKKTKWPKSFRL